MTDKPENELTDEQVEGVAESLFDSYARLVGMAANEISKGQK